MVKFRLTKAENRTENIHSQSEQSNQQAAIKMDRNNNQDLYKRRESNGRGEDHKKDSSASNGKGIFSNMQKSTDKLWTRRDDRSNDKYKSKK